MTVFTQNNLKNSPIFNISMCSLENFHTCFLQWLGNKYKKEFVKLLTDKDYSNDCLIDFKTQVHCGANNILDLLIEIKNKNNTEYIIIENKIKSIATADQLKKYQECFKDKSAEFILLSLAPKHDVLNGWRYMSYLKLTEILSEITEVKTLAELFKIENTYKYDFYKENKFDELDLKDIYIKYKTSELANYIKENINRTDWDIGYSFHNKKGTIDISKNFNNSILGLQIEGNQYRYFLRTDIKDSSERARINREKIAKSLFEKQYWFLGTIETKRSQIYKGFCGYTPDVIYRYFLIENDVSYEKIVEQIKNDIAFVDKNFNSIKQIISNNILLCH